MTARAKSFIYIVLLTFLFLAPSQSARAIQKQKLMQSQDLEKCIRIDHKIEVSSQKIDAGDTILTKLDQEVKELHSRLTEQAKSIDTTNADSVNQHNKEINTYTAKVEEYNKLLKQRKADIKTYKKLQKQFNTQCADQPFDKKDYLKVLEQTGLKPGRLMSGEKE